MRFQINFIALFSAVSVMIAAGSSSVRGATITETFSFAPLSGYTLEDGTSIAAFDPALGTLNSATFELNATATFSNGDINDFNQVQYTIRVGSIVEALAVVTVGNSSGSDSATNTLTDSPDLASLSRSPALSTQVTVQNLGNTATILSSFGTETVIYNYTPASAMTPEPAASALLFLGFLALPIFHKLRKRAQTR